MKTQLHLCEIIVKFFQPLIGRYRLLTISASLIITVAFYAGVDIGVAEVVRQNSYPIHMLSVEMLIEPGPDYVEASTELAVMLRKYIEHMERRHLSRILRVMYPRYSPKRALASALSGLEEATNNKEAKEAIYQAGLASNQFYKLSKRFPQSPIAWFEYEELPDELTRDLDNAFDASGEIVDKLANEKTVEVAIVTCRDTCRKSREAILLLLLARLGYENKEKISRFRSDVKRAHDCTLLLAKRMEEDKTRQKLLYEAARDETRQIKILEAVLDNDMDRVCELLEEAIKGALEKEEADLPP